MIKNLANIKTYITLAVASNKSEDEICAVLAGKIINGVKADNMAIIKFSSVI